MEKHKGRHVAGADDEPTVDGTTADDATVDEIREEDPRTDLVGDERDPYELRSFPAGPDRSDDDPASWLGR